MSSAYSEPPKTVHAARGIPLRALGAKPQLSGHTHDGQLWPFRWLVRLWFRDTAGLARSGASLLFVSRGTGTWGPPLRFLAPPEVTLFELVPAD